MWGGRQRELPGSSEEVLGPAGEVRENSFRRKIFPNPAIKTELGYRERKVGDRGRVFQLEETI